MSNGRSKELIFQCPGFVMPSTGVGMSAWRPKVDCENLLRINVYKDSVGRTWVRCIQEGDEASDPEWRRGRGSYLYLKTIPKPIYRGGGYECQYNFGPQLLIVTKTIGCRKCHTRHGIKKFKEVDL